MKIWFEYGSEHSANLVMIGKFVEIADAQHAKEVLERLTEGVEADIEAGNLALGQSADRFSEDMLGLLSELGVHSVGPDELLQLAYESHIAIEEDKLIITTEEIDVSAVLKILVNSGARVEVFSAHDYPGTGFGRGERRGGA